MRPTLWPYLSGIEERLKEGSRKHIEEEKFDVNLGSYLMGEKGVHRVLNVRLVHLREEVLDALVVPVVVHHQEPDLTGRHKR